MIPIHPQRGQKVHIIHGRLEGQIIKVVDWAQNIFKQSPIFKGFVYGKVDGISESVRESELGSIVNVGDEQSLLALYCMNATCQKHRDYFLENLLK